MRVMVLIKATEQSEAGEMPSQELLEQMTAFNEELVRAGVMLAGEGLHPSSEGVRGEFSGSERQAMHGPLPRRRSSPRWSSGRSRAFRITRAPGSWPPPSIASSTGCGARRSTSVRPRSSAAMRNCARPLMRRTLRPRPTTRSTTTCCGSSSPPCHPVLSPDARVALTLRLLCGLTTREIARAYLASESAVAQRIVRAKRTLSAARVPFVVPGRDELSERLASVLEVVYLIFNEGYA